MLNAFGDVEVAGIQAAEGLLSDDVCRSIDYHHQAASTNTLALDDLRSGKVDREAWPKLYFCDAQTSGRGRHGRTWISTSGALTFSLLLNRPDAEVITLLPLAVGVGIARCVEFDFAPLQTKLKWPNDVHMDGGKVAGVLLETNQTGIQGVVIGVGINVADAPELSSPGVASQPAQSLSRVVGRDIQRYTVLPAVVQGILQTIADLQASRADVLDQFRQRCLLSGQKIQYQDGTMQREGLCQGVDEEGRLLVKVGDQIQRINSGEARLVRSTSP